MLKFRRVGAALFTFAKPECTKKVIESILKNRKIGYNIDWHVFHDGAVNINSGRRYTTDEISQQTLEIIKNSGLSYESLTVNEYNEGIARQKHKAHQLYTDYDLMYFFEDDLLLGAYYLRLLKILAHSYPRQVGTLHKHFNDGGFNQVYAYSGAARLWGYYMPRQVYTQIDASWQEYYKKIERQDYIGTKTLGWPRAARHDVNLTKMIKSANKVKLWPCTTRARNIGERGHIAYREGGTLWKKNKLHLQPTIISYPRYDKRVMRFIRRDK